MLTDVGHGRCVGQQCAGKALLAARCGGRQFLVTDQTSQNAGQQGLGGAGKGTPVYAEPVIP